MHPKLMALAATLALAGCFSSDGGSAGPAAEKRPGQIRLVAMEGMGKAAVAQGGHAYVFDLDTARGSYQQYFILQNTGDVDITDIALSTDNPNMTFSPSHISVLPPSSGASLLQVIKLNVQHGKKLEELGYGGFLAPGLNIVEAQIAGTTVDGVDTLPVEESATLKIYAKLARFDVVAQGTSYSLVALPNGYTGMGNNWGLTPHYYVPIDTLLNPDNIISLKNTGNVPLLVRRWATGSQDTLPTLRLGVDSSFSFTSVVLEIDAHGVIFSPPGLPLSDVGTARFLLYGDRTP